MGLFQRKKQDFKLTKPLIHIAFIMDGNGRWAKKKLLPRHLGHKEGCKRIIEVFNACKKLNIRVFTLYAFSTENWKRPQDEIKHLFNYLEEFFQQEIEQLMRDGVQVRTMGNLVDLPEKTQKIVNVAKERTKDNQNFIFNICLSYGGRDEIVKATQAYTLDVLKGKQNLDKISEAEFAKYLMSSGLPEVDLMIRTSGEERLSNFLLWQLAYSELVFTKTTWPDFTATELIECLKIFEKRNRRHGGLKDE